MPMLLVEITIVLPGGLVNSCLVVLGVRGRFSQWVLVNCDLHLALLFLETSMRGFTGTKWEVCFLGQ